MCFLAILIPSTRALPSFLKTRKTFPGLPLSLPDVAITVSFFFILNILLLSCLYYFRSQGYDFHKVPIPELPGNGAEYPGAFRIALEINNHRGIAVKS